MIHCEAANDLASLAAVVDAAREFLAAWELDADDIGDVLVVLDEVASNVVRHAWLDGGVHRFRLALAASSSERGVELSITVEDDGIAFDPTRSGRADPVLLSDNAVVGGHGLRLVAAMTDAMNYSRCDGCNRLTVLKHVACPRNGTIE
jgi:serine/threonine-protein kinase RsbW